jgi:hypothetical protein
MEHSEQANEHFRASLVVVSTELRLAEITEAMGQDPDQGFDHGEPMPLGKSRSWSKWCLGLAFDDALHRGCDGLSPAIVGLGNDLADRAAALHARGCSIVLQITQFIDPEDLMTDGVHVDEAAVMWLARAQACLDVDQYAADATFVRAARSWLDSRVWNVRAIRWFVRSRLPERWRR